MAKTTAFAKFLKQATKPHPETMTAGEQAACLWWSSLSPMERETLHKQRHGGESPLEPRWQVGRLHREAWENLSRWGYIRDRISAAVDTALAECMGKNPTAAAPGPRAAYRWWADMDDQERCVVFGRCCPDAQARVDATSLRRRS